ncbi:MAG: TadE/TadG family type IV pilus assembly protein [Aquihabitans sp.]
MTDALRRRRQRGQATVEVALALPVVVCVLLAVVQVALVARSQILVTHAAREAARQIAVDPDQSRAAAVARSTPGLEPQRVLVEVGPRGPVGSTVAVTVTYRAPTDVPLVGALFGEPDLQATVAMRVETGATETSDVGPGP